MCISTLWLVDNSNFSERKQAEPQLGAGWREGRLRTALRRLGALPGFTFSLVPCALWPGDPCHFRSEEGGTSGQILSILGDGHSALGGLF